jgi:hypothetical protein
LIITYSESIVQALTPLLDLGFNDEVLSAKKPYLKRWQKKGLWLRIEPHRHTRKPYLHLEKVSNK